MIKKFPVNLISKIVPKWAYKTTKTRSEFIICVHSDFLYNFLYFLKDFSLIQCKVLIDITAIDFHKKSCRFRLIYNLLSIQFAARIRVFVDINEMQTVGSLSQLFRSSQWFEREVWDLYGIFFENHPDLRRILTDYGFDGHPLRKDFPLSGFFEVRFDDTKKRVIYEPLQLTQEMRYFDFANPWALKHLRFL